MKKTAIIVGGISILALSIVTVSTIVLTKELMKGISKISEPLEVEDEEDEIDPDQLTRLKERFGARH